MTLTAGAISLVSKTATTVNLSATAASGGTGPYTQQWYRSTTTGFTPGGGNILSGKTALTLADTDALLPNTTYYYKMVYTDTGASNATVTATQLAVTTTGNAQNISQFAQTSNVGVLDLLDSNVVAMQVDVTQTTPLYPGSAVKVVDNANGLPTVVACSADSDDVFGFIVYDIKSASFSAGARIQVAFDLACMWLYATEAIARMAAVAIEPLSVGGVKAAAGETGATVVGRAYDKATAAAQLIRVLIRTPSEITI